MHISDFDIYKELLEKKSGLSLSPDKCYLLDSRLTPVSKKWNFPSLDAMTVALRGVQDPALVKDIVEAMTTNETSFFRDGKPFDIFKNVVLPYMGPKRTAKKKIRIWCAASSSGQEPYSLAISFLENKAKYPGINLEIVATDISDDILAKARAGTFSQFEVQRGLPIQLLIKYFKQDEEKWVISDEIKKMIRFDNFNLLNDMTVLGKFDIIFCRNVLIYFDEATKKMVFQRMAGRLENDGFLFLGGAETVLGITDCFQPYKKCRGLYLKSDGTYEEETLEKLAES